MLQNSNYPLWDAQRIHKNFGHAQGPSFLFFKPIIIIQLVGPKKKISKNDGKRKDRENSIKKTSKAVTQIFLCFLQGFRLPKYDRKNNANSREKKRKYIYEQRMLDQKVAEGGESVYPINKICCMTIKLFPRQWGK